jgi:hypothetical protein
VTLNPEAEGSRELVAHPYPAALHAEYADKAEAA